MEKKVIDKQTDKSGVTFGTTLSKFISYTNWHSIFWDIFHGLLGWVYVIYFILFH